MTTYRTGNPVGSSDPRDLYDNAENLDNLVNGDQPAYNDRLGKSRRSWQSVEDQVNQQEAEFNAAQDDRQGVFNAYLVSAGYQFAGDYAAGIEIAQYNQVVRDTNGEFWRLSGSTTLPYTTTGAGLPEGGAFVAVGDAVLRQELAGNIASGQGAAMVNGATIYIGSVAEGFAGLTGVDGAQYASNSFHVGNRYGRRTFVYRANEPKSNHGKTGWSPTVPAISSQPGANLNEKTLAFLNATGETDPSGTGLFVFSDEQIMTSHDVGALPESGGVNSLLQFGIDNFESFVISNGNYEIDFADSPTGIIPKAGKKLYWHDAALVSLATDRSDYAIVRCNFSSHGCTLVNPVIIGDRDIHIGTTGESGMCISTYSARDVTITNPTLSKAWGDGIYVGADGADNPGSVDIKGVARIFDCRRQGISLIHCDRFTADTLRISDIGGVDPGYGIDIEPNRPTQYFKHVHIKDLITSNTNCGLGIALRQLSTASEPVGVTIDKYSDTGSVYGIVADVTGGDEPTGSIYIGQASVKRPGRSGLHCRRWTEIGPKMHIGSLYIEDANQIGTAFASDGAPVSLLTLAGESAGHPLANVQIDSVEIVKTAADASPLTVDFSIIDKENNKARNISITNIITEAATLFGSDSALTVNADPTNKVWRYGEGHVQSGSNSNGSWVKYPDGTLRQYAKINLSFSGTVADWTLPTPFVNTNYIYGCTGIDQNRDNFVTTWSTSQQLVNRCRFRSNVSDGSRLVMVFAEGRWK